MELPPGFRYDAAGNLEKRGAIFDVPLALVLRGLEAVGAIPTGGHIDPAAGVPDSLTVKVHHPLLPVVPEGAEYTRRGPWRAK